MKRRNVVGSIVAASAVLAAGLYRFTDLFVKHYPPTPYDDLLEQLSDREQATKLGAKAQGPFDTKSLAQRIRPALQGRSLATAANGDIAAGRMVEVQGWVLPETVALLSVLAARV
jgi:hypothetical protein